MKLSEAILLGSTVLNRQGGSVFASDGKSGCALGMGLAASGSIAQMLRYCNESTMEHELRIRWPWIYTLEVPLHPCGCFKMELIWPGSNRKAAVVSITHLFDTHVCGMKDWTLDQLVAWIASIEPASEGESLGLGTHELLPANQAVQAQR